MPTNITPYVPPSVITKNLTNLNGSDLYVAPNVIAIVARIDHYPVRSTSRVLGNGSTAVINDANVIAGTVTLKDYSGVTLIEDEDYTIAIDDEENTFSVTVINDQIKTQSILISYQYLPDDFFNPLIWYTKANVESYYGVAYNDDGTVASPITAAARMAFDNGGVAVGVVPVYDKDASGPDANPTQDLEAALEKLKLRDDIALVVPVGFDENELDLFRQHILWCCEHRHERRGIFAVDGTAQTYTVEDLCDIARSIDYEQIMFIANNIAPVYVADSRTTVDLPGWLIAAAAAGVAMAYPVYRSLTRLTLQGFQGVHRFLYDEKCTLAQAGCSVIEMVNGQIRFMHSVTTRQSMMLDWSYAGVYNYIAQSIRYYLDVYIGLPSNDTILTEIKATCDLFLTNQVETGYIYSYDDLEVSRRNGNPEIVDVSFRYAWCRPLLWVICSVAVDLSY